MVYEQFLKSVQNSLKERLEPDYNVTIQTVTKNNGLTYDGISIKKKEEPLVPFVYLNSYYHSFLSGTPLETITHNLLTLLQNNDLPKIPSAEVFLEPERITDTIIYRLINETANRKRLEDLPHISIPNLDLSLIFYLSITETSDHLFTALIHKRHQKMWNLSTDDLYQMAKSNTPRLFPARITSLPEMIRDITKRSPDLKIVEKDIDDIFDSTSLYPPMYVLTNDVGTNGSVCMFYEGILKDFASHLGKDLIILPSSIHEVLIIPADKKISYHELAETVHSINQEEVPNEDRLSNHIYLYSLSKDQLTLAFTSSVSIETTNP
ncbi:DUF5688 family protein [Clostridium sp. E02]|uniref:DUF5688 family protein n=1 Tax=Clostridium sp. E02 TaxID=2487134 RepID=UPI000F52A66C|nr:DUF5688 family protein [Clostridium sp. E02]